MIFILRKLESSKGYCGIVIVYGWLMIIILKGNFYLGIYIYCICSKMFVIKKIKDIIINKI